MPSICQPLKHLCNSADMAKHILIVEDAVPMAALCAEYLSRANYRALLVGDGASALKAIAETQPQAALLDYELPDMTGLDVLRQIQLNAPHTVVIMMTASASVEHAAEAMRLGAHDFLQKPFTAERLLVTLKNALEKNLYQRELQEILASQTGNGFGPFIGAAPVMQAVYRTIQHVAASRVPVFITGESGTGKELAAQSLHSHSPRHTKPFRAINCGAIAANLMESELFGHVKGAFTGANADRPGLLQQADGGTVFLDEIGDMPLELQVKLLRVIQTQSVRAVGSDKDTKINVRFIAATNRDILADVRAEKFREDLFYRLYVVPLEMPRLAEREGDIIALANHFLQQYANEEGKPLAGFDAAVQSIFMGYDWPGNVRELENTVRHAVAMAGQKITVITENLLPAGMLTARRVAYVPPSVVLPTPNIRPLWQTERDAIMAALQATTDDVGRAAALLEISPSTIYRKLESWRKQAG